MKKEMVTRFIIGTIEDLAKIIYDDEKMKKCYLFAPPSISANRKNYTHDEVLWEEGGHIYTAASTYYNIREFIYWRTFYTRDRKPATLTEIRNSYNRMKEEDKK